MRPWNYDAETLAGVESVQEIQQLSQGGGRRVASAMRNLIVKKDDRVELKPLLRSPQIPGAEGGTRRDSNIALKAGITSARMT